MDKKLLVSILAMTSAPSLTAWADANLGSLKTDKVSDWGVTDDQTNIKLEDGLIVSTDGTAVKRTIKLAPGTYTLTAADTNNVTIKVSGRDKALGEAIKDKDGKEVLGAQQFTVDGDAVKDVTVTLEAIEAGKAFTVGGFTLTLNYDFEANRKALEAELSKIANRIKDGDDAASQLKNESARIAAKIAKLDDNNDIDEESGTNSAYEAYVNYHMWKGTDGCTITTGDLKTFEAQVTAQANNTGAYQTATALIKTQQKNLDTAKEELASYKDNKELAEGTFDYATKVTQDRLDAAQAFIDAYKAKADEAYKVGTAGTVLTPEANKAFTDDIMDKDGNVTQKGASTLIQEFADAVAAAPADHAAYLTINERVTALKAQEEQALQAIYKELTDKDAEDNEVYTDKQDEAQGELNKVLMAINAIVAKNGDKYNHEGSAALFKENEDYLKVNGTCQKEISETEAKWVDYAQQMKKAYADAKTIRENLQNQLDEMTKVPAIQDNWKKETDSIQSQITALYNKIEADNKAHKFDQNGYESYKTDIEGALAKLDQDAKFDIDNYEAYKKAKQDVQVAQTELDSAKAYVAKLEGKDKVDYSTNGKYDQTETALQNELDSIAALIENNFAGKDKDGKPGKDITCADVDYGFGDFKNKVDRYKRDAETARDNYVLVTNTLKDYNTDYAKLEKKVSDPAVKVGAQEDKTYGNELARIKGVIDGIQKLLDDATASTDTLYNNGLANAKNELANGSDIATDVETLVKSYDADKDAYDKDIVEQAVAKVLDDANALIEANKTAIEAIKTDDGKLGLRNEDIVSEKAGLIEANTKQEKAKNDAKGKENKAEAMAELTTIKTALTEIANSIARLDAKASSIREEVKANSDKYAELTQDDKGILTDIQKGISSILSTSADDNREEEFASLQNDLQTVLDALTGDVKKSHAAETLVADMADKTVDKVTVEGYTKRIATLQKAVGEALAEAKASAANRKAYDETLKHYNTKNLYATIAKVKGDVALEENGGSYADAKAHYESVLDGYSEATGDIYDAIENAYKAPERNSAAKQDSLTKCIDALLTNVNSVANTAKKNKVDYEALCDLHSYVSDYCLKVYAHVNDNDESSKQEEYQKKLTSIRTNLTTTKTLINASFAGGEYGDHETLRDKHEAELNGYLASIKNLETEQAEGYNKLIAQDNAKRHDAFNTELGKARAYFRTAVDTIGLYSNLKNEELREVATEAVGTANTRLNKILNELNSIASKELKEYTATQTPDLFDRNEEFRKLANAQYMEIQNVLDQLDNVVSSKARELYGNAVTESDRAVMDTLSAIEAITSDETADEVLKAATDLATAQNYVEAARNAADGNDFALTADALMNNLSKVNSLLANAKEQAAGKEWSLCYEQSTKTRSAERDTLSRFEYLPKEDRKFAEDYEGVWKDKKTADKLVALNDEVAGYSKNANLFDHVQLKKEELESLCSTATDIYNAAKDASARNEENLKAYNNRTAEVDHLQKALDAAQAYAQAYANTYRMAETVAAQQRVLDVITQELADGLQTGGCMDYKIETDVIEEAIANIYSQASTDEHNWLVSQAQGLDGDYVKAYAANDEEAKKYEQQKNDLQKAINSYSFNVKDDKGKETAKDKQTVQKELLDYETQIAKLRSNLALIYDADLTATTLANLNEALTKVKADYDTEKGKLDVCRQEAKDNYRGKLNAVKESINGIQANIDAYSEVDGKILLCQAELEGAISKTAKALEEVKPSIATEYARYEANKAAYEKLDAEVKSYTTSLTAATTTIEGYTLVDQTEASEQADQIGKDIAACQKALDESNQKMELTADSKVTDFDQKDVPGSIAKMLKEYTFTENDALINRTGTELDKVGTRMKELKFTKATQKELACVLDSLQQKQVALSNYNGNAYWNGRVTTDIDGNKLDEAQSIDYMKDAAQAVTERIASIGEAAKALSEKAENESYILGDLDRDGQVQANDYMAIMNVVLGKTQLEEGSVEYLAADANENGHVDAGDLVTVVNAVLGIRTVDALEQVLATNSMEHMGEVQMALVEGRAGKRMAIKLNSTNRYVACQMDVQLPAGVTVTGESIEGMNDHSLYTATLADGTQRLVVSSLENAVLDTEGNATIYLDVEGNGAEAISVTNVTAADAAGATYSIVGQGQATGIDGMKATTTSTGLKQRVYSIGGQMMDSVKKGINIIRNADGSARKVLKK